MQRVFRERFRGQSAKNSSESGSGMGLAITKHLVDTHGGTISIRSHEDGPTTFLLSLPITSAPAAISAG